MKFLGKLLLLVLLIGAAAAGSLTPTQFGFCEQG